MRIWVCSRICSTRNSQSTTRIDKKLPDANIANLVRRNHQEIASGLDLPLSSCLVHEFCSE
ncbi:hypothetical protein BVRB_6g144920 [Beta vulgaris subsp. vulgaris]|nr:hypothetical protein BVRB_6g144920 [Beta vulgaris subsp. vulgaris]